MENEKEGIKKKEETKEGTEKPKMKGTVAWFNEGRGYGFLIGEDANQYFVHFSDIITDKDFKMLYEAEKVLFEPARDKQGRNKAINVVKIEKPKE